MHSPPPFPTTTTNTIFLFLVSVSVFSIEVPNKNQLECKSFLYQATISYLAQSHPVVCRISDSSVSLQLSCGFLLLNHKSRGRGGRKNSDLLIATRASCHATTATAAVIGRSLKHAAANLPAVIGSLCLAGQLCFISGFLFDSNFIFFLASVVFWKRV